MEKLLEAIEKRLSLLPEGLRSHVERTRVMARDIAETHGIDPTRCDIGAAAHDLAPLEPGLKLVEHLELA